MEGLKGHWELAILTILASKPAHGWEIAEKARRRSEGVFELGEGGVYLVLHKMEHQGLLDSSWQQVAGRNRRVYRLTRKGRAELAKRQEAWGRVVAGMRALMEST